MMEDLFSMAERAAGGAGKPVADADAGDRPRRNAPLADRMRPRTLDEFLGQSQIVGKGRLLRRAIEADRLTSCIFYGPPGTGKTTLASIIARTTNAAFEQMNAVTSGVADVREVLKRAKERLTLYGKPTYLLLDDFAKALSLADEVVLADIYAARETDNLGISSDTLREKIEALGTTAHYFRSFDAIENFLLENVQSGDLLLTMGAGDVYQIGEHILGK